ncbi:ATP-dependent DNA helicase RecG [Flavobacteriaceae bacterium]|nr:ATP-dependent DNA helicase RecG [Flavobacteriaceae bacterium]
MNSALLQTPIAYLKTIGPTRAKLLKEQLGIHTYQDLLHFFPNRYVDRTQFHHINQLETSQAEVQIVGVITQIETIAQKKGSRLVAKFSDNTGAMELVWFKGAKWIKESIKPNTPYVIFGKISVFQGKFSMAHPDMELLENYQAKNRLGLQAIYPSTERLSNANMGNRFMLRAMEQLFNECGSAFEETLSDSIMEHLKLLQRSTALFHIHFPKDAKMLSRAMARLKFEELFFIQLQLIRKNLIRKKKIKGLPFNEVGAYFNDFYNNHLPFQLTNAQKRVIKEIRTDVGSNAQMNRLLQGDVGSGKTIVAVMSILFALDNGYQACLMAPTEILANQHFKGVSELLEPLGIQVALLTGNVKKSDRKPLLESLQSGELNVLIGTHALLEDTVVYKNLGLAIIDEQHRFGVAQRAKLWHKNTIPPHVLVMTATPIPRTLAMSIYGDLDISIIDELPPGRKEIKTVWRSDSHRLGVFKFISEEIKKGRQIYVVYPLINESEALDYKDLMDGYDSISRSFPAPEFQVSIVHGQMNAEAKAYEMDRFVKGETQIMVATTVIEVGVNVPNASVMIIESAERFGLSQLHQLRGRVGRGAEQSFCILMSGNKVSQEGKTRLETMVDSSDGFEIAEVDLKLRGPGDLMGTQQSGVLQLKIADIVKDADLLKKAREVAVTTLKSDPYLDTATNKPILLAYRALVKHKNIWNYIS